MGAHSSSALTSKRIPDPHTHLVVVGPPRIAVVHRVRAAQKAKREDRRQPVETKSHAGAAFEVIGPVLALSVGGDVGVPQELGMKSGQTLGLPQRVSGTVLRIRQ